MSRMRFPLKDWLVDPVDEAAIHRIAERIDNRGRDRRRRLVPLLVLGTAAAAILIMTSTLLRRRPAALALADGRALVAVQAANGLEELPLSDGSRIRLAPGAGFEPLHSSADSFWGMVTHGRVDFSVRPGGSRHWIIECGLATVEVTGTAFACERTPGHLRIVVDHGVVLVRGERVPDRVRRLAAGQSIELADAPRGATAAASSAPAAPAAQSGASDQSATETPLAATPDRAHADALAGQSKSWRALARHGHPSEAFAVLGMDGLRREAKRLGVDDLLALADVARLSGHPAEAVAPLERILGHFADDAQAPLAAFALGRLELDSLGHPQSAVWAFGKALDLGIPRGLREDVRARLVEACVRSGDRAAAERAAEAYRDEFPDGRHAQAIRGWLHSR